MTPRRSPTNRPPEARQRGVTLVTVLWMVSALALAAASLATAQRADLRLSLRHAEQARAAALGDAVVRLAALELLDAGDDAGRTIATGEYALDGRRVPFRILPATGFVNLNAAPELLLRELLVHGGGVDPPEAVALARGIVAWRTPDAFEPDGRAATGDGPPLRRRTGFAVPEDLLQLPGFDLDILEAIRPLVSVHGPPGGRVDPLTASPEVLAVLAGGDRALAQRVAAARDRDGALADTTGLAQAHLAPGARSSTYRIEAFVPARDGGYLLRAHWVALRGHPRLPWRTLRIEPVVGTAEAF